MCHDAVRAPPPRRCTRANDSLPTVDVWNSFHYFCVDDEQWACSSNRFVPSRCVVVLCPVAVRRVGRPELQRGCWHVRYCERDCVLCVCVCLFVCLCFCLLFDCVCVFSTESALHPIRLWRELFAHPIERVHSSLGSADVFGRRFRVTTARRV